MDLTFFRRAEQCFASRWAAQFDFGMLVAMLQAQRSAGGSAEAEALAAAPSVRDPIAEILLGGPCWRGAVAAQGGCFNPAFARQRGVN